MKSVLIIGKVWPEPKSSAAGTRMMQILGFLLKHDFSISFATGAKKTGFEEDLEFLGINCLTIKMNCDSFNAQLSEINPDVVVFDRFMVEEQYGWRVAQVCPKALTILNTEDLHALREARQTAYKKKTEIDIYNLRTETLFRELSSIHRCDKSLFVSEFEIDLLTNKYEVSKEKLIYFPVLIDEVIIDTPSYEQRKDLLFIGNFYHEPNWDALLYLKNEIWPELRKRLPEAKLNVFGAYPSEKVFNLRNEKEKFYVHGRVEDATEVTLQARVSLVPLVYGAGIKGKILEAMACGTPFVSTEIGAEGMIGNDFEAQISTSTKDFVEKVAKLYGSEEKWKEAKRRTFEAVHKFDGEQYEKSLLELFHSDKEKSKSLTESLINFNSIKSTKYFSKWIMEKNKK